MARYTFDPDAVAHDEAAGWRAYYDRDWRQMLQLMIHLCRTQFHMPLPAALVAAYYTVQASRYWIPPRLQPERVQYYLTRFYRQARAHSGLSFDPARAGKLELAYWDVARRYRPGNATREEYIGIMTDLHSEVFGIDRAAAAESAELRVRANELVDEITAGTTADAERNWAELEDKLRQCYRSIQMAQEK